MRKEPIPKHFIIAEIKRIAADLGHSPGKGEFLVNAGIRESDWSGRYWARWSDALREAGFEPNEMRQPHQEAHLIGSLVALIRELGKFPTRAEMRLKRRADPSFPDAKTFERFGARSELAASVQRYCEKHDGFSDVIDACMAVAVSHSQTRGAEATDETRDGFGFVYLIRSGRYYKIGRSNAAGRREYELAIQLPERAKTIHVIRTDDPVGIERYWHQRFEGRRKNGEWFELEAVDVKAFTRRKFM